MIAYRHIIFLITIVAFLAALLTFIPGCLLDEDDSRGVLIIKGLKSPSPSPSLDEVLDEMKFENAPTLGPVARKCLVAGIKGEWEKVWDMMSKELHEMTEKLWKSLKENPFDFPHLAKLAKEAGSAKEYYILTMKEDEKSEEEWVKEITEDEEKFEVTGEGFSDDGKTGWLKVKNLKTGEEKKMFRLLKEGDEWKIGLGWGLAL